ncbi:hypothetical protein D3C80_1463830 [compost metagenome]
MFAAVLNRPLSTCACGPRCTMTPLWYWPRRAMAVPARMFSLTACSMKPDGAKTFTLPALTSASSMMPRAPPKWSIWLWL